MIKIKKRLVSTSALLLIMLGSLVSAQEMADNANVIEQGSQPVRSPDFLLPGIDETVALSEHLGRVVYVDFWASWCTPCKKSFSWMNAMQDRYGNKGLTIIAINLDESRHDAKAFLDENPAQFSVAFDPEGRTAELYEVQGMPSSYLISSDGAIAYRHLGFRPTDKRMLEAAIEHLIGTL